ncbi:MAG: hypothetical protein K1X57_07120 [Gemmataceae bacterium]|nr:hypothetical protein [Gemmataceae bacterium]
MVAGTVDSTRAAAEIHDVANGTVGPAIHLPIDRIESVTFAPDGDSVYFLSATRVVRLDMAALRPNLAFNREGPIDMATHPELWVVDGNLIGLEFDIRQFGGGFRWRIVYNNPRSKVADVFGGIRSLRALSVSPKGLLALGTNKNEVHILDAATCAPLFQVGTWADSAVEEVALSPDGKCLAYFAGGTLSVVELTTAIEQAKKRNLIDDITLDKARKVFHLTSASGRFRAEFPAKPQFDARQRRYSAQLGKAGQRLEVGWIDLGDMRARKATRDSQLLDIYDEIAKSLAKHTNGELGEMTDTRTAHGLQRRLDWNFIQDGVAMSGRAQLSHRDGRMYSVTITHFDSDPVAAAEVESWFAAFAMTGRP